MLIDVSELDHRLRSGQDIRLLDIRWHPTKPDGHADFRAGHIPGALFVDLERDLSSPTGPDLRHPLPSPAEFQATARRLGLSSASVVVAYDDRSNLSAARAWWLLHAAGLANVALLDGGMAEWRRAGLEIERSDTPPPPPGDLKIERYRLPLLSADEAEAFPAHGLLLDTRSRPRYLGTQETLDPRAGHIPGAWNLPAEFHVDAEGRFRSPSDIRAALSALRPDAPADTAVYCGSGLAAARTVFALMLAGLSAPALYSGSWSEWARQPHRPVRQGPDP